MRIISQKIQVIRISDLSGDDLGDGGQTVKFSVGNDQYEMDLSDTEVGEFYDVIGKYTEVASKVAGRGMRKAGGGSSTKTDPEQLKAIRKWAKENGFNPSDRGRVSQEIKDAYEAAH